LKLDSALANGVAEAWGFADGVPENGATGGAALCVATGDGVALSMGGSMAIDEKASGPPNQLLQNG
jgi:hypothetical protein